MYEVHTNDFFAPRFDVFEDSLSLLPASRSWTQCAGTRALLTCQQDAFAVVIPKHFWGYDCSVVALLWATRRDMNAFQKGY
jgi:hypothetical protein